jgi:hypothetical protein
MADVTDRDGKEAALSKPIAREFNRFRLQIIGLIPELEPWMYDIAPEFWQEHATNLEGAISPLLAGTFIAQAETMLGEFDFLGVDWGLVNQGAVDWARKYTYDLVKGIEKTTRGYLQKVIPQYFETQMTQGELAKILTDSKLFGPVRSTMIARTEVTRAASQGELQIANLLEEQGIHMLHIWQTRNDELVCPLCGPKNQKEITDGVYPPLHINCRCFWSQRIP